MQEVTTHSNLKDMRPQTRHYLIIHYWRQFYHHSEVTFDPITSSEFVTDWLQDLKK